jgi:hypothetical protein
MTDPSVTHPGNRLSRLDRVRPPDHVDIGFAGRATQIGSTKRAEPRSGKRRRGGRNNQYLAECTSGFFNSEGDIANSKGLMANNYGSTGRFKFFQLLKAWRADGRLDCLDPR